MGINYLDLLDKDDGEPRMVAVPAEGKTAPVVYAAGLTAEAKRRSTHSREAKMAKGKGKKKAKRSKGKLSKAARREIALKNLAKARRARKAKAKGAPKAARKPKARRSAKQKAAALANLKKARSAVKRKKKGGKAFRAPRMPKRAPVRAAAKRKRKLTKAERATISRRNLKKARAAQKRGGRKSATRRSKGRRKGKLSKAQRRAIALRNLGKARAARRRGKASGKKHKVKPYSYSVRSKKVHVPAHKSWEGRGRRRQSKKQRAASLRNLKKARAARRRGKGAAEPRRKRGKRRQSAKQRAASLRNLAKARTARKNATKRHGVRPYSYHRQGGKRRVPSHMSFEYAMENPLTLKEAAWGAGTGIVYFVATDAVDRFWATHALAAKGSSDANGHALYADVPVTAATMWTGYVGVYNPTAICAPMNLVRYGSGALMVVVPWVGARFVQNPFWRSQLQVAGYAAFIRIGGKAVIDLIAKLAMWTQTGQRLYDGEMRAAVMTSTDQSPLASLPSAGLGAISGCGACPSCTMGVGACASGPSGVGYPSMPREAVASNAPTASTPATANQPTNLPPPPVPPSSSSSSTNTSTSSSPLQGVSGPALLPARSTSLYDWGAKEEVEEVAA